MPDTPLPTAPRGLAGRGPGPTDADRDRVAAVLSASFADDSLTLEQFEERVAEVYRATTGAALNALIADLQPAAPLGDGGSAVAAADTVPAHDRRFAVLANLEHHSMTVVPRRLDVSAVFGNVELDLRAAKYGAGETELHLRSIFGNITITLPAGAVVEQQASSVLGSIECLPSPASAGRSGHPIVRLTGHAILGAVEIRFADRAASGRGKREGARRLDRERGAP